MIILTFSYPFFSLSNINNFLSVLLTLIIGGGSKALMFVHISPSYNDVSETVSSLSLASDVRHIALGPAKKQVDTVEFVKIKQEVSCCCAFS